MHLLTGLFANSITSRTCSFHIIFPTIVTVLRSPNRWRSHQLINSTCMKFPDPLTGEEVSIKNAIKQGIVEPYINSDNLVEVGGGFLLLSIHSAKVISIIPKMISITPQK